MTCTAIIVAGGEGTRLGLEGGKQLAIVAGRPVLAHTVAAFEECPAVDSIVVVANPLQLHQYAAALDPLDLRKLVALVPGGDTRAGSVAAGLAVASGDTIIIHDGARPLVTSTVIENAVSTLLGDSAADGLVVGHPSYDTVKSVSDDGYVDRTEDRARLWLAQTPQVFRAGVLRDAYARAAAEGFTGTDDASLVEHAGGQVRLMLGPRDNIKVTVPEDLVVVERLLEERAVDL